MRTPKCTLALFLALTAAPPLLAQSPGSPPVFVAVPETFPDLDARAVVLREPERIILLLRPDEMDAETLAAALAVLRRVEREHPLEPGRGQMIPITGFVSPELPDVERRRLTGLLTQLSRRPVSTVGNVGPGRWIRYTES